MKDDRQGILVPVSVPWMISPSTPFLQVFASEDVEESPTKIRFVGYFALEDVKNDDSEQARRRERVAVVENPFADGSPTFASRPSPYKKVVVVFSGGVWVEFRPTFAEPTSEELDYDWSQVPDFFDPSASLADHSRRFREEWRRTSRCPNPGMYEVEDSGWLKRLGSLSLGCRHFLLLGHDAEVEILAKAWIWETEGDIHGW